MQSASHVRAESPSVPPHSSFSMLRRTDKHFHNLQKSGTVYCRTKTYEKHCQRSYTHTCSQWGHGLWSMVHRIHAKQTPSLHRVHCTAKIFHKIFWGTGLEDKRREKSLVTSWVPTAFKWQSSGFSETFLHHTSCHYYVSNQTVEVLPFIRLGQIHCRSNSPEDSCSLGKFELV